MNRNLLLIMAMLLAGWRLGIESAPARTMPALSQATAATPVASVSPPGAPRPGVVTPSGAAPTVMPDSSLKPPAVLGPADVPTPTDEELEAVAELIVHIDGQQEGLEDIFKNMQGVLQQFREEVKP
ncbi:MAG: hypothetical protein M5U01_07505 [Ardenticatenaceae bacterium]|nr:hypothetical protein [Ardenticatenaceae bacterium]